MPCHSTRTWPRSTRSTTCFAGYRYGFCPTAALLRLRLPATGGPPEPASRWPADVNRPCYVGLQPPISIQKYPKKGTEKSTSHGMNEAVTTPNGAREGNGISLFRSRCLRRDRQKAAPATACQTWARPEADRSTAAGPSARCRPKTRDRNPRARRP